MIIRLLLAILLLTVTNAPLALATDNTKLKISITPLGCRADIIDDGLHVFQHADPHFCGIDPEDIPHPQHKPNDNDEDVIPGITFINKSDVAQNNETILTQDKLSALQPAASNSSDYNLVARLTTAQIKFPHILGVLTFGSLLSLLFLGILSRY